VIKQTPLPGTNLLLHRGDSVIFQLHVENIPSGEAFLRTNLGRADTRRTEQIRHTEHGIPPLGRAWNDIAMRKVAGNIFEIRLPLFEVGVFEAKCWFRNPEVARPIWASGSGNVTIKVEPAENYCANTIYTVFPRQFSAAMTPNHPIENEELAEQLDRQGYTVIPPSGTFRDVIRQLDFIIGTLRSRIIQLLPIHPIPTAYGKMGRYGSPFASLDYFSVEPALAEFDTHTTPLEQFQELVDAVHTRGSRIFLDIPVNHTGWASRLHCEHPEWYVRNPDGTFQSPGAWGAVWEDLSKLNYQLPEVHRLMAEVFLYWCHRGVDGFRCDAGYMLPYDAWLYITSKVRHEYPNTVFLLEGLGGPWETVEKLLGGAGLDWAYSELFQNYDREQITNYLEKWCYPVSNTLGAQAHFAETHDNLRLAAKSPLWAKMRTALCALFSVDGSFGITNGVEWYAAERVNVHGSASLNWGAGENQTAEIRRLQTILSIHPAFAAGAKLQFIHGKDGNTLALRRESAEDDSLVLVLINLDTEREQPVSWDASLFPSENLYDLMGGEQFNRPAAAYVMKPGEIRCLTPKSAELDELNRQLKTPWIFPGKILRQKRRALASELYVRYHGFTDMKAFNIDQLARKLQRDPYQACVELEGSDFPSVTEWHDGVDQRRIVMLPPRNILIIYSDVFFKVDLIKGKKTIASTACLPADNGRFYAMITHLHNNKTYAEMLDLKLTVFRGGKAKHSSGTIMLLPDSAHTERCTMIPQSELRKNSYFGLCTSRLGAYSLVCGDWGGIAGKYNALLAANINTDFPVDNTVMLTRCRAWLVYQGYSRDIDLPCQTRFYAEQNNTVGWEFNIVAGQGKSVELSIVLRMSEEGDAISLIFERPPAGQAAEQLEDHLPVRVILRPDLECRSIHEVTRAYTGPEQAFARAVSIDGSQVVFEPAPDRKLTLTPSEGRFTLEPEWKYMVPLPREQERGLDSHTDLFSPGYFAFDLKGGEHRVLFAEVNNAERVRQPYVRKMPEQLPLELSMRYALRHFVVRRDQWHTVIAGYPWFLDWGRDTLICLRGLIPAGFTHESEEIIRQFAHFELDGTLPNVIRGNDVSNRDTSDAPLWLFVAVSDYIRAAGNADILEMDCGGRTVLNVLRSILIHYRSGTANGIRMDEESGLIFSPSHFTWMDTNYPAGTPREGYPIEIQALWTAALKLVGEYDPVWRELREKVLDSIEKYYILPGHDYLSDCLHAAPGQSAAQAVPDDACRPNQLFAITLDALRHREVQVKILRSCACLLVPGAIRSLADAPVKYPVPVSYNGRQLNDPYRPYAGRYLGDEDTRRKLAYHNGTAWGWVFPTYCEAMYKLDPASQPRAEALLLSSAVHLCGGAPGQLPEIIDGDSPHEWRGCVAQAWSMSELYRVYRIIREKTEPQPPLD
jgi:predicted glycogen debranching enzyme